MPAVVDHTELLEMVDTALRVADLLERQGRWPGWECLSLSRSRLDDDRVVHWDVVNSSDKYALVPR